MVTFSGLQDLTSDAIEGQKYHVNLCSILKVY